MAWGIPAGSRGKLQSDLEKLKAAAPLPPEEAIYGYLEKLHRLRRKHKPNAIKKALRVKKPKIGAKRKPTLVHHIIDATMRKHVSPGMRWKYEQVLLFAREQKVRPKDLKAFIRKHGGINGCVDKYREMKRASAASTKRTASAKDETEWG